MAQRELERGGRGGVAAQKVDVTWGEEARLASQSVGAGPVVKMRSQRRGQTSNIIRV